MEKHNDYINKTDLINELNPNNSKEFKEDLTQFHVTLSLEEKIKCLKEIISKLKKILYVYDKTLEKDSNYNYKIYCGGILIYVSSSNYLFNGELVNIVVNLNAIVNNDFSKQQIKRLVFETINFTQYILTNYIELKKNQDSEVEQKIKELTELREAVSSLSNRDSSNPSY